MTHCQKDTIKINPENLPQKDICVQDILYSNGWGQYQMFVLKQIEDHGNLMAKILEKHNEFQVIISLMKKEIEQNTKMIEKLEALLIKSKDEKRESDIRLEALEREKEIDNKTNLKLKIIWTSIGGGIIAFLSFIVHIIENILLYFNNNK